MLQLQLLLLKFIVHRTCYFVVVVAFLPFLLCAHSLCVVCLLSAYFRFLQSGLVHCIVYTSEYVYFCAPNLNIISPRNDRIESRHVETKHFIDAKTEISGCVHFVCVCVYF